MLGRTVRDPLGIEGNVLEIAGLGLLDIDTVMDAEKTVRNSTATTVADGDALSGYQIHLGITEGVDCGRPFAIVDGVADGAMSGDGRVMGTYLHGLFSSDSYRSRLLQSFGLTGDNRNYRAGVEAALDAVAADLETYLDKSWLDRLLD
jgi:adenosylcobyric acid synthase